MTATVATEAPPVVHWNDDASLPHCGAPTPVDGTLHGHRDRDQATCPSCVPQPGTLVRVRPDVLLLERNIRQTTIDKDFVASVKDLGVLEPITAVLNDDGDLVVRFGHRRTLAAVEAMVRQVPVYVTGSDDLADAAEVDRIIRQHDENTQRRPLTAGEQVGVVEQLAAFGISANQIAKRARVPRPQVDAALTVSQSPLASKAAAKYEALTLDQAAVVAEFEDDPETAKALVVAAVDNPSSFAHVAQQQRDDRTEREAKAAVAAALADGGVTVIDPPLWDSKTKNLSYLKVSVNGAKLTKVNHAKCPGHVAWVAFSGWGGKDGGEREYGAEYGCANPAKHGHFNWASGGSSRSTRTPADELTPEQREANAAARRLVIDNNKAWASAKTVRQQWLAELAATKTPPKGAAAFITRTLALNSHGLSDYQGAALAVEWLCLKTTSTNDRYQGAALAVEWLCLKTTSTNDRAIAAAAEEATEARALHIALIRCAAAYEASCMSEQTWRTDGKHSEGGHYLRYLESIGYGLSDVEKFAISSRTA